MFVFKVTETDTGRVLTYEEMTNFCSKNKLTTAPLIKIVKGIPETLESCLEEADGASVINPDVLREGVVYRDIKDSSIGFKIKSREYAIWFEKYKPK